MRHRKAILAAALVMAGLPIFAGTITFDVEQHCNMHPIPGCLILTGSPEFGELSYTVNSAPDSVTVEAQGTLGFRVGGSPSLGIPPSLAERLNTPVIAVGPSEMGQFSVVSSHTDAYVWAVTAASPVTAELCGSGVFDGAGGTDCGLTLSYPVPVLGENPPLSQTLHLTGGGGDTFVARTVTDVLQQKFNLAFLGSPDSPLYPGFQGPVDIRVVIDQVGTLRGPNATVVVPEPGSGVLIIASVALVVGFKRAAYRMSRFRIASGAPSS